MKNLVFVVLASLIIACNSKPLETLEGAKTAIEFEKNTRAMVYFFIVPDCPFAQYYTLAINQAYSVFNQKGVQFCAIVPGDLYTRSEVLAFKNKFSFLPQIFIDKSYSLTHKYKVTVVPQIVVTDKNGDVLYSGKIDDQAIAPGQKKYQPQVFYLLNALNAIVMDREIAVKHTEAVGCFVE